MTGNYDITFYCTGLWIVISGVMVIPVAKSLSCWKRSSTISKDLLASDTRSSKVRFQEPDEKDISKNSLDVKDEVRVPRDRRNIYNSKGQEENSIPLLSGEGKACDVVGKTENDKLVTMYENPLSLV